MTLNSIRRRLVVEMLKMHNIGTSPVVAISRGAIRLVYCSAVSICPAVTPVISSASSFFLPFPFSNTTSLHAQ